MPNCKNCNQPFTITDQDRAFYVKIGVPEPTCCPDCRQQRRAVWRNLRHLYKRKCDFSGKEIISTYPADASFPVYDQQVWHSDKWDPLDYGREYDFSRSFFEQFKELCDVVPKISLLAVGNENSEYVSSSAWNKNCYLIYSSDKNEDCFYDYSTFNCKSVVDSDFTFDSQMCYQCLDCEKCNRVFFSQDCRSCRDSYFLYDCHGCKNCFGCTNLRGQEYYAFNQPIGESEFEKLVSSLKSQEKIEAYLSQFEDLKVKAIHAYYHGYNNDKCQGDYLKNCRNAVAVFNGEDLQDCSYCVRLYKSTDCYDIYGWGMPAELCYECHLVGDGAYHCLFCDFCFTKIANLCYCYGCQLSHDLFGCVGLKAAEFCILNKKYSEKEYQNLMQKIIEQMKKDGEWGERFPVNLSPFAYNETTAMDYFPLTKEEVSAKGWRWHDDEDKAIDSNFPVCRLCQRNFRLIPEEKIFYNHLGLPEPIICSNCRFDLRLKLRNKSTLYHRQCMCEQTGHGHVGRCPVEFETTYSPDRPEKVYCEECYQKEIY